MKKTPMIKNGLFPVLAAYLMLSSLLCLNLKAATFTGKIIYTDIVQSTVFGTITDTKGQPILGVTIQIEGTNIGTISEVDGSYSIETYLDNVLHISAIGYKNQTVSINGRLEINIILEEDVTQLDEVVLNAGYYTVSEKERTGNIATIKAETIDKQPVGNPLAAMQGQMSGVNIVQETGVPGGGFNVEIRGRNFIDGASDPFYIVDGVPYNSNSLGSDNVSGLILGGNISPLNAINPNDIESIEVLKDADATAIYGSRAANGVVLITTKKGKIGETRFDAHLSSTLGSVSNFLELMNTEDYLEIRREGIENDGFGALLEDPAFDFIWPDIKSWDNSRYTDWQKELIGNTSYRNNAQISVSGGSSMTQFLISGGYQKETTVFIGDANYQKMTLHSNINHRSSNDKFTINLSTTYTKENNQLPSSDFSLLAYSLEPNAPELYDADGNINWENNTWNNPIAALQENYESISNTLITNALVSYALLPNLEIKSSLGLTSYRLDSFNSLPSSARNPALGLTPQNYSSLTTNSSKRSSWIVEPQLHWKRKWDKLGLDVLVGTTFQQENSQQLVQKGTGFPNNSLLNNLSAATTVEALSDTDSEYNYNAIFSRLNLKVMDRYILNLTARRDGSSRFGSEKQFGNFGAVGIAWIFSEEKIIKAGSLLSFGKIRGSFGTTGSDNIGDYRFLDTYSVTGFDYDGTTSLGPTGIFNPLFGWESNKKLEAAIELGFFKDRLLINTSWYRNRSSNQLIGIPLAATTGFSELTGNFDAVVENSGLELDIHTINLKTEKFKWSTTFNITVPKNKLVDFDGLETSTFADRFVIGKPVTIVKLYHAIGVDPATGVYQFEDYNDDGSISSLDDREWTEDLAPEFYGGLGNTFSFGKFNFDFFFQFKKQKAYNTFRFRSTPGTKGNAPIILLDRWREPGDLNPIQKASGGLSLEENVGALHERSNAAVSDASFIRLRNVTLNYKIPTQENGWDANVYLQGQNLLTFTPYDGPDPEQPSNTRLPPIRQITLGIQLSF
tara:strand:- start:14200 stop:17250 length:3051 start_codon:yes stop_codon:yes gene_type:complete